MNRSMNSIQRKKREQKKIRQDVQVRVKGENQFGSIDDEVFASAHFSQDPQSITDFE